MVLITGGTGLLGSYIIENYEDSILHPTSKEMDICSSKSVNNFFDKNPNISLVFHAAAYTDVRASQTDLIRCAEVNVNGTLNVLRECVVRNIKIVYISTDAVFDGKDGKYTVDSYIKPISNYAKTKASAELIVTGYKNSLVIRTSFFGKTFPYERAFTDQWTTKDYIDVMGPMIYSEAMSGKYGVSHIFSKRRTLYELAVMRKPDVEPITRQEINLKYPLPFDLSLK